MQIVKQIFNAIDPLVSSDLNEEIIQLNKLNIYGNHI